ncbi:hypothetical protein V2A60_004091 [Cordyceps javanica]
MLLLAAPTAACTPALRRHGAWSSRHYGCGPNRPPHGILGTRLPLPATRWRGRGAEGQLAALDLRREGGIFTGVPQYNYGSPRICNDVLVRYPGGARRRRVTYRITHYQDVATTYVPLAAGFRHPFPEYWLRDGLATRTEHDIGDVQVCTGTEQEQCSESLVNLSLNSHMHYFQQLWPCYRLTAK